MGETAGHEQGDSGTDEQHEPDSESRVDQHPPVLGRLVSRRYDQPDCPRGLRSSVRRVGAPVRIPNDANELTKVRIDPAVADGRPRHLRTPGQRGRRSGPARRVEQRSIGCIHLGSNDVGVCQGRVDRLAQVQGRPCEQPESAGVRQEARGRLQARAGLALELDVEDGIRGHPRAEAEDQKGDDHSRHEVRPDAELSQPNHIAILSKGDRPLSFGVGERRDERPPARNRARTSSPVRPASPSASRARAERPFSTKTSPTDCEDGRATQGWKGSGSPHSGHHVHPERIRASQILHSAQGEVPHFGQACARFEIFEPQAAQAIRRAALPGRGAVLLLGFGGGGFVGGFVGRLGGSLGGFVAGPAGGVAGGRAGGFAGLRDALAFFGLRALRLERRVRSATSRAARGGAMGRPSAGKGNPQAQCFASLETRFPQCGQVRTDMPPLAGRCSPFGLYRQAGDTIDRKGAPGRAHDPVCRVGGKVIHRPRRVLGLSPLRRPR